MYSKYEIFLSLVGNFLFIYLERGVFVSSMLYQIWHTYDIFQSAGGWVIRNRLLSTFHFMEILKKV